MKISRQVGTVSQILQLYVQDFSVTTGAGLPNVPASNISFSWFRSNQNGASTGTGGSTGTLGIYSSGAWLQINSATARGWYQFGIPNDALLSGDSSGLHIYVSTGPLTLAPLPVEIELTKTNNQQYASSTVHSSTNIVASVTSTLVVSTQTIDKGGYGVTSISAAVTTTANVVQIYGSAAVTSASGQFRVSTQAIDKGGYGVTTIAADVTTNANVMQAYGSAIVTSAAGQFRVSTQAIDKGGYGVTSISAAVTTTANVVQIMGTASPALAGYVGIDWAFVTSKAAYNDLSSTFISTNQSIAGASAPTAAQVAIAVWDEIATSHSVSSSFGFLTKTMASNISSVAYSSDARLAFLDVSVSSRITSSQVASSSQIVSGIWDEIATSHSASSSFANVLKAGMSNVSTLITGVNITSIMGTTSPARPGYVGIDWAFVTSKAAYNDLSSTFISTNQSIAGASAPTAAQVAAAVWSEINSSYSGVSTFGYLSKQITSISAGVNVTAFSGAITTNANLLQIYGSPAVTSASGQLRVSTQAIDKGGYGVTTIAANITTNANVLQVYASPIVTSAAGILTVSTQTLSGGAGSVNVSSIAGSPVATSGAGILTVSTQTIPTFSVPGDAMALTAGERASVAGVILSTTQAESYRASSAVGSVMQLMYEMLGNVTDMSNSGTTRTLNSVTSHAAGSVQYQYDSTTPSAITRIA